MRIYHDEKTDDESDWVVVSRFVVLTGLEGLNNSTND